MYAYLVSHKFIWWCLSCGDRLTPTWYESDLCIYAVCPLAMISYCVTWTNLQPCISAVGLHWHKEHFCCSRCNADLSTGKRRLAQVSSNWSLKCSCSLSLLSLSLLLLSPNVLPSLSSLSLFPSQLAFLLPPSPHLPRWGFQHGKQLAILC